MSYSFADLKKKYDSFRHPVLEIEVSGNKVSEAKKLRLAVSDVVIDLSAGYEASQATFTLYNVYSQEDTSFDTKNTKKYILLGSPVTIWAGYNNYATAIFAGIITKVNFIYEEGDIPGIQVTAMDVKAVMMANSYSRQLKASSYSDAVKEIFDQSIYMNLRGDGAITELTINSTPDASLTGALPGGAAGAAAGELAANSTDKSIEMVAESDYEFVVKVAKKYNYDFYVSAGQVMFRSAKSDSSTLMEISSQFPIKELNVEYDVTSQVGTVEVRGLDAGKAKVLVGKAKNSNKLSQGNKAKSLVSGSTYVYVDPTVTTTEEAQYRAKYIQEDRTYRLCTLELTMVGLPELLPGRFVELTGFGTGVDNTFYLQNVKHTLDAEGRYLTKLIGKAASAKTDAMGAMTGSLPI